MDDSGVAALLRTSDVVTTTRNTKPPPPVNLDFNRLGNSGPFVPPPCMSDRSRTLRGNGDPKLHPRTDTFDRYDMVVQNRNISDEALTRVVLDESNALSGRPEIQNLNQNDNVSKRFDPSTKSALNHNINVFKPSSRCGPTNPKTRLYANADSAWNALDDVSTLRARQRLERSVNFFESQSASNREFWSGKTFYTAFGDPWIRRDTRDKERLYAGVVQMSEEQAKDFVSRMKS